LHSSDLGTHRRERGQRKKRRERAEKHRIVEVVLRSHTENVLPRFKPFSKRLPDPASLRSLLDFPAIVFAFVFASIPAVSLRFSRSLRFLR
jgi:hypothetical protein